MQDQKGFILKNKQINKFFLLIPAGVILAGVLLFLGLRNSGNDTDCQNTVATLQTLENSDISETEQKLQDLKAQETQDATEVTDDTTLLTDVQLRQVFAGSVILGDSITNSIVEYGYLDTDVVVAKLGLSVAGADEQIDTAIGLKPTHVFMAFGSNDLETYGSNSSEFIAAYKTQIQKIQAALPDVPIYINCILPITDDAIAATPDLAYYPEYNDGLQTMCQEMGCTFIDNSSIIESSSENLYEPDGEHVIQDYYPKWLTHIAQAAGLQT